MAEVSFYSTAGADDRFATKGETEFTKSGLLYAIDGMPTPSVKVPLGAFSPRTMYAVVEDFDILSGGGQHMARLGGSAAEGFIVFQPGSNGLVARDWQLAIYTQGGASNLQAWFGCGRSVGIKRILWMTMSDLSVPNPTIEVGFDTAEVSNRLRNFDVGRGIADGFVTRVTHTPYQFTHTAEVYLGAHTPRQREVVLARLRAEYPLPEEETSTGTSATYSLQDFSNIDGTLPSGWTALSGTWSGVRGVLRESSATITGD